MQHLILLAIIFLIVTTTTPVVNASSTLTEADLSTIDRADIATDAQREQILMTAGLLSEYEISAKKLIDAVNDSNTDAVVIKSLAQELLAMSENVIESAKFRLPQCDTYLQQTLQLKHKLTSISLDSLEKDYHLDGALPDAPAECYHTKDLFVHPATVIVLIRDDPSLELATRSTINKEIQEVLAHTNIVRKLLFF